MRDGKKARRAVFLDRDGVINRAFVRGGRPYPPDTLQEMEILPGVVETIEDLHRAGFLVIVATNQPDVATAKQKREVVEAMHRKLFDTLAIDDIKVCYGVEGDDCPCYKPKPGMLVEAAHEWNIDLTRSYMVGDRWRDIGAGRAAGCHTVFIDYGYNERRPEDPDYVVRDIFEAGRIILNDVSGGKPGQVS